MSDEYSQSDPDFDEYGNYIPHKAAEESPAVTPPPTEPAPSRAKYQREWRAKNSVHYREQARKYRQKRRDFRLLTDPSFKPRPRLTKPTQ